MNSFHSLTSTQAPVDQSQFRSTTTAQSSSSSSSQDHDEQPILPPPAHATVSSGLRTLSGEPRLEEVFEAVRLARAKKESPIQALSHLLEHFNKDWLFKLYGQTKSPQLLTILGQKIEIRQEFENSLRLLASKSTTTQRPSCFICFALESDVSAWLEKVFVPDLELVYVDPVFCLKQFGPGKELNAFQAMIRTTDKVVVICTPLLKQSCFERQTSPTGVAQEIRLAKERYNDREKFETIFPVFLKGERKEVLPDSFFEPILGTVLNENGNVVWSYYAQAFELFAGIRGIERSEARKIKESFFQTVQTILEKKVFSFDQLKDKSRHQDADMEIRVKGISENITRQMRKITLPPYPMNFTGRSDELKKLKTFYESGIRRVALIGPSGVGKSALALAFAYQCKHLFEFIYVIQVSNNAPLKQGLLKLADEMNFRGTEAERLKSLKDALKGFNQKHLILLDNVDDFDLYDELKDFIEHSQSCCFLLTSVMTERPRQLGFSPIKLNCFPPEDATTFLQQATLHTDEDNANSVSNTLLFYPLALTRAAEYIRTNNCSISAFAQRYQREGEKLLSITFDQGIHTNLTPWRVYLKKIQNKMNDNTCAARILALFPFLDKLTIDREGLQSWAFTKGLCRDMYFDRSLGWLIEYGLIVSPRIDLYVLSPFLSNEIIDCLRITAQRKLFLYQMNFEKYIFFAEDKPKMDKSSNYISCPITTADSEKPITAAIKLLSKDKHLQLCIEGHSDNIGQEEVRNRISELRAEYTKELIVQRNVAFKERINCIGIGSSKPLDTSSNPAYERNRVAVIRINIEKSLELEDLFSVEHLADLLNAKETSPTITANISLQCLVIQALKIKFYSNNFLHYVFFGKNKLELTNPEEYEGYIPGTRIEKPLSAVRSLLALNRFVHFTIEGSLDDTNLLEDLIYLSSQIPHDRSKSRAESISWLIFQRSRNDSVLSRINAIGRRTTKPLDTSEKPVPSRNRVATIRIDIEKSSSSYLAQSDFNFTYQDPEITSQPELDD